MGRQSDWEERIARRRAEVMDLPVVALRPPTALEPPEPGDVVAVRSVSAHGAVIALWTTENDHPALFSRTVAPSGASFADTRASRPVPARVTVDLAGRRTVTRLSSVPLAFPDVQALPDGRILVIGSRSRSGEDNALVYDADGQIVGRYPVGDGVQDVRTTPDGYTWVSYFDQGVFGDQDALGAAGLVRLSPDMTADWRFNDEDNPAPEIHDCYALTLAGETAWACYYSDFPVVRVERGHVTPWRNDLAGGVRALAVGGSEVALFGGYQADSDRLLLSSSGTGALERVGEYRVTLADGAPLPRETYAVGHGADLHLFVGTDWYRLGIEDIPGHR